MADLVHPQEIEDIVGMLRHASRHIAEARVSDEMVYILHSSECVQSGIDLRDCAFSVALDNGIDLHDWEPYLDTPVYIEIQHDQIVPWLTRA